MTQRIAYAPLPSIGDRQLLATLTRVFAFVTRGEAPPWKTLRDWLREQDLWHKVDAPRALEVVGLRTPADKAAPVRVGPLAATYLAAEGEEAQGRTLFDHLWGQNPLLAKYVLDALDPEQNGRLHSTHELHRMLSSFVYPGQRISLLDFQAWIRWATGAGAIKLVGIRWGLTDLGREFAARSKGFDVEEFLEEEAEAGEEETEAESETEAPSESEARPGGGLHPPAQTDTPTEARTETEAETRPVGALHATPTGPATGTQRSAARPRTSGPSAAPAAPRVVPGAPQPPPVVTWLAPSLPVTPLFAPGDDEIAATLAHLTRAWQQLGKPGHLSLEAFGIGADEIHDRPDTFLLRVAFVSLVADLPGVRGRIEQQVALYRQLADAEFFEAYVDLDQPLDEALPDPAWSLEVAEPSLRSRLIELVPLKRNLRREPEWFAAIQGQGEPLAVIEALRAGPFAGVPAPLAPYWLTRELHRLELLAGESHAALAAVPGLPGRKAAARLGFLDRAWAAGDADLVRAGAHLATWFTRDTDYAEPLETIPSRLGCTDEGPAPHACPFACLAKLPWNR